MDVKRLGSVDPRSSVLLFPWQLGLLQPLPPTANPCRGKEILFPQWLLSTSSSLCWLRTSVFAGVLFHGGLCRGWMLTALGASCAEGNGPWAGLVPAAQGCVPTSKVNVQPLPQPVSCCLKT